MNSEFKELWMIYLTPDRDNRIVFFTIQMLALFFEVITDWYEASITLYMLDGKHKLTFINSFVTERHSCFALGFHNTV